MRASKPSAARRRLIALGRALLGLLLAAGLLFMTWRQASAGPRIDWAAVSWARLVLAAAALGLVLMINSVRWGVLLRVQGIRLPFQERLRLNVMSGFFSMLLPGAVSGDLVKMAMVARQTPAKRTEGVLSIVADRLCGMTALFVLATLLVLGNGRRLLALDAGFTDVKIAGLAVIAASGIALLALVVFALHGPLMRIPQARQLGAWLGKRLPARILDVLARVWGVLTLYRRNSQALALAFLLAMITQITLGLLLWLVGRGLGETRLPVADYLLSAALANSLSAIPLTPAGLGLRDMAVTRLFTALGAGAAAAVPLVQSLILAFWALVGGALFAFAPTGGTLPTTDKRNAP